MISPIKLSTFSTDIYNGEHGQDRNMGERKSWKVSRGIWRLCVTHCDFVTKILLK